MYLLYLERMSANTAQLDAIQSCSMKDGFWIVALLHAYCTTSLSVRSFLFFVSPKFDQRCPRFYHFQKGFIDGVDLA